VRDRDAIYYTLSEEPSEPAVARETPTRPAAPVPMPVVVAPQLAAPASVAIADAPVDGLHFLRVLLAIRLKQKLESISPDATLKQLAGGKSALQNEIVGDMEKEFGSKAEDNMAELPLKALAAKAGGSYNRLGEVSNSLISKMLGRKMPGGFSLSSLRTYLATKCSLPDGRIQVSRLALPPRGICIFLVLKPVPLKGVLLHSLTMEPADRLASEGDATKWLDAVVSSYAATVGISLPSASAGAAPVAVSAVPVTGIIPLTPKTTSCLCSYSNSECCAQHVGRSTDRFGCLDNRVVRQIEGSAQRNRRGDEDPRPRGREIGTAERSSGRPFQRIRETS